MYLGRDDRASLAAAAASDRPSLAELPGGED
jgi:hypothetical protein